MIGQLKSFCSLEDYFYYSEWELRLDRTMDRIEDRLFDYPAIAWDWAHRLDPLFDHRPDSVSPAQRLRAAALLATARSLLGEVETGCQEMAITLERAQALGNDLAEDIRGWMHAKYAVMLIKLDRADEAAATIREGLDGLRSKSEPVKAVIAQLYLAHARIHRHQRRWQQAFDWCKRAYDLATHRRPREGGYYRRGDVTRTAAVFNLVQLTEMLAREPAQCLRLLVDECNFRVYRSIRTNWGFAPFHEIATTRAIGVLQAKTGDLREAIDNLEYAARAYLRSACPLDAIETAIELAALAPDHPTITRVAETVADSDLLSPELATKVAERTATDWATDPELCAVIAEERRRRHLPSVYT